MNTLLRKAAENGGVHPVYLDGLSSEYAARIETLGSTNQVAALMSEIFRGYCLLVRSHSVKDYSPPVQKVITLIDSDLTGNLTLHNFAKILNVSGSYLSTLFKIGKHNLVILIQIVIQIYIYSCNLLIAFHYRF